MTFRELDERSNQLARLWRSHGLDVGDHVAIFSENQPRFFEVMWAALRSGLYVTTINSYLSPEEVAYILNDSGAKSLVTTSAKAATASAALQEATGVELALLIGESQAGFEPYVDAINATDGSNESAATKRSGVKSIEAVAAFLKVPVDTTVKAVVVQGDDSVGGRPVLLLLRGDHELNEVKAQKLAGVRNPITFATPESIHDAFGAAPGSLGPVGFAGRVVMDRTVAAMADFVTGANDDDHHYTGVNIGRDFPEAEVSDLRNVMAGDPTPDGKGALEICRGIEVGHIFQLRTKYSEALGCKFLNEQGKEQIMEMGCYGIGVSRILGAAIEQNNDARGIIWPDAIAPFQVAIVPMGYAKSEAVRTAADALYADLCAAGIDAFLDDRDERPGSLLADNELIGTPHRVVIGDRGLKDGVVEYQGRRDADATRLPVADAAATVRARLKA